jgi:multidrug efflux system outer membrane protein
MRNLIFCSLLILSVAGCMVGPNYRRPEVPTPQSWRVTEKETKNLADTAWWEQFQDPVLNDLICTALRENNDVRIAFARVDEFRGMYVETRADLFPQVGADAVGGRKRLTQDNDPAHTSEGRFPLRPAKRLRARLNEMLQPTVVPIYDMYQFHMNANWELDLWGRMRRATEAAQANLFASEEFRRGVILALVADVAGAYIDLRDLDRQRDIIVDTIRSRKATLDLFQSKFKGGMVSELELSQVESEYEEAVAALPEVEKGIAFQENMLSVLIGRNPGPIPRGRPLDNLKAPVIPSGLPSDLLERRPDIRQAEQQLIAANAQIGVAKALYFPTISLTGSFGRESTECSNLWNGPARVWNYGVPISMPIFTGGNIAGQVQAAEAVQQEMLYHYRKVIQIAFREFEDSLTDQAKTRERLDARGRQVKALRNYVRLAWKRYNEGYVSYLEVLDAERSLFNAELSYAQTQGLLLRAWVGLYKAMGGGWVADAENVAAEAIALGQEKPTSRPCSTAPATRPAK